MVEQCKHYLSKHCLKLGAGRLLPLFPPFSMTWQMPEVVIAESLCFDNIEISNMSACILTSSGRILNAALRLSFLDAQIKQNLYYFAGAGPFVAFVLF